MPIATEHRLGGRHNSAGKRNFRVKGYLAIVTLLLPLTAAAHDTWLLPEHAILDKPGPLSLQMSSGEKFAQLQYAIEAARIDRSGCRIAGVKCPMKTTRRARNALQLDALFRTSGVAAFWLQLKPRTLVLTADQVREYLTEIDAPAEIRRAWETMSEPRHWRETYRKHAKSFVRVGAGAGDRSWAEAVGLDFEIVPEADPTALQAGETLPVRLLYRGEPLKDFGFGFVADGSSTSNLTKTDADGRARVSFDRSGRWLLRATILRKSAATDVDWESDFTTLTLEVH
jgi:uncharacterized GH25 family protein